MLEQTELLQYSRQIILPEIDIEGQEKIKQSHVLIVGLGGLGSSAAMYLAASGVGQLTLIDHDKVEQSNLQRQIIHQVSSIGESKVESAKNSLLGLNPKTNVSTLEDKATEELLDQLLLETDVDVILDCSDNFETRFAINKASIDKQIPLISATAVGFEGQLAKFNHIAGSACYNCLYSTRQLPEGDCEAQGILSPVVGTMGCLQATETLKIIIDLNQGTSSFLLTYNSLKTEFKSYAVKKDPACSACRS